MAYFRETGRVNTGLIASQSGAGDVVAAPGAGRRIIILDILASADTNLRESSGGGDIVHVPAGSSNLSSPIAWEENTLVYSTAGNVSITYVIKRV